MAGIRVMQAVAGMLSAGKAHLSAQMTESGLQ